MCYVPTQIPRYPEFAPLALVNNQVSTALNRFTSTEVWAQWPRLMPVRIDRERHGGGVRRIRMLISAAVAEL